MADRNLDIALRIKADLDSARAGLDQLNKTLGTTGKQADTTSAAIGRSGQRIDALLASTAQVVQLLQRMDARLESIASGSAQAAQATEQVAVTTQAAAAAVRQLAETEDEAATRIRAVVAASREQIAAEQAAAAATAETAAAHRERSAAASDVGNAIERQNAQMRQTSAILAQESAAERAAAATTQDHAAELGRLIGQIDPTIAALERLDQQEAALQRYRNTGLLDEEGFQRFRGQIDTSRQALGKMGVSAGQTAQAMRLLPAQITDVTVSLAAGMPLWLVAIQQGGQIKDSFGGIGNAVRGIASLITPARLAIGGLAIGITALAAAAIKGYLEQERLNTAIVASGNFAGTTAGEVQSLAVSLGASNIGAAKARDILNGLISSGRISSDAFASVGQAAVNMAALTGKSAQEVVSEFSKLADDPVRAAEELDRQYHFLTASVYEQVVQLQAAGREYDALKLVASQFTEETQKRLDDLANSKSWAELFGDRFVRDNGFTRIARYVEDLGRHKDAIQQFTAALADYNETIRKIDTYRAAGSSDSLVDALIARANEQRQKLIALQPAALAEQNKAKNEAAAKQDERNGIAAIKRLDDLAKGYDQVADRQKIIKKLNDDIALQYKTTATLPAGVDQAEGGGFSGKGYDFLLKKALGESTKAPKVKDTTNALAAAQQQLENQILALGDNALGPVTGIWDKYTQAMLAAGAAGGKAIKAGGDVAAVQTQVQKVQELASAARDRALADQQRSLQIAYAQATGDQATAAKLQIEAQYGDLLADLQRRGDAAGVKLVQSLINVGEARAQLQQLQQQVDTILGDQSRQEQAIQAEQQAGLITEYTARQRILELHKSTAVQLEKMLPLLRAAALASGDPRAIEAVKQLDGEVQRLKINANDLQTAFNSGLTSGLEQALVGLSNRTLTVAGAFRTLATTVAQSLAQVAARALAAKAVEALGSLFGGDKKQSADVGAGATKLGYSSVALGIASKLLGSNADKLSNAAYELAIANGIGLASGYASGGYTGPGGVYQVAGVVHAGEYVQPQYRMSEPGAIAFMRDFHQRGMDAIGAWSSVGYAQGGLVAPLTDVPRLQARATPRAPLPAAANDARGGAGAAVHFNNVNVVDPELVRGYLRGNGGRDDVLNIIRDNRSTIRQYVNR